VAEWCQSNMVACVGRGVMTQQYYYTPMVMCQGAYPWEVVSIMVVSEA